MRGCKSECTAWVVLAALRACVPCTPMFLCASTRKTGRCAPPPPPPLAASLFSHPSKNEKKGFWIRSGAPGVMALHPLVKHTEKKYLTPENARLGMPVFEACILPYTGPPRPIGIVSQSSHCRVLLIWIVCALVKSICFRNHAMILLYGVRKYVLFWRRCTPCPEQCMVYRKARTFADYDPNLRPVTSGDLGLYVCHCLLSRTKIVQNYVRW